ncbi:lipopolysaccharide biosynthesis protein [Desmospora activa]|uniref:O-antigen/teichoic acid export membrane protein n=1 Tax=Desmospora activa DSM 45169 TaxID=1121389 RepID=A0A2T4ZCK6_9BACL|nr:oligosaccharide flippase family protein [Desmospora activa]PTM59609.1 O-antigen/teichoic acid export membrane protein [Desmospora activa DSM 45169]
MLGKLKQLLSDSFAFSIALMGNKLVGMLLFPVFARSLDTAQYGDWDMTNSIAMVLTYLCILGTDSALAFYHFDDKEEVERKRYFTAALLFPVMLGTGLVIAALFVSNPLSSVLYQNNSGYSHLFLYAMVMILANIIIHQILAYARFTRRVWTFNLGTAAYVIGSSLWSIGFVVIADMGVVGIFLGQIVGQWSVALVLLWLFRKQLTRSVQWDYLQRLLRYGAPLLPALLAFWVMNALSRPMIYHWISAEAAGLFGAAARIASIIVLFTSAFQLAWRPFALSIKEQVDAPRIYSMVGRGYLVGATFFLLALTWSIQPVIQILTGDAEYLSAYPYVWLLALGTILNGMTGIVGVGLLIHKRTKAISYTFMMAACLFVTGTILLIPWWGLWAPTIMTGVAYGFAVLSIYRKAQRMYLVNFRMPSLLWYLSICIGCYSLLTLGQLQEWEHWWLLGPLSFTIMVIAVFMTGVLQWKTVPFFLHRLPQFVRRGM